MRCHCSSNASTAYCLSGSQYARFQPRRGEALTSLRRIPAMRSSSAITASVTVPHWEQPVSPPQPVSSGRAPTELRRLDAERDGRHLRGHLVARRRCGRDTGGVQAPRRAGPTALTPPAAVLVSICTLEETVQFEHSTDIYWRPTTVIPGPLW